MIKRYSRGRAKAMKLLDLNDAACKVRRLASSGPLCDGLALATGFELAIVRR